MQSPLGLMVEVLVVAYAVLVASLVGSFINLAADRVPRGESVVRPRSRCRSCGRVLNLVDLIPVAGYLIRRGRCATCGVQIGASAPLIEGLCALSMLVAISLLGLALGAAVGFAAVALTGAIWVGTSVARAPIRRGGSRLG
ncbi:MAG: prepilin peptidase [Chloroflexi bacterium]|nr:MAG: prepilin peptidase [Chloroflexota bacterium]